jgi:precorrin-2 dehydrogenase/sirohydrochlorin ferrochelatase
MNPPFDLPLFLNCQDMLAVVVGGGTVGQRKVRMLVAAGAKVRVIDPLDPPRELLHEQLEWRSEVYRSSHLDGAWLVFTAAPTAVNETVDADARERGLLVCRADSVYASDFITPATAVCGERLKIAVSTGGVSPSLARRIRDRLAEMFDDEFVNWIQLLEIERGWAQLGIWTPPEGRKEYLERISEWHWLDLYRAEGRGAVVGAYQELARKLGLAGMIL